MRDNYVKLIDFIFGKYMYTVMKNNDKVLYFEVVNNKYVQPISSFNLYDNEGKSLTSVNEHFFMNQLVNRINVACKKGIFISDQEIVDYLNKIKSSCENLELKKLFKGTYMTEINEFNFESNKRNILNFLDKFKYDTFVDYNNVSIFDGSLEKGISHNNTTDTVEQSNSQELVETPDMTSEAINNSDDLEVIDVIDEPTVENVQQSQNVVSSDIDFMNIPVDNSSGDVVSSSDYFSNSQPVQTSEHLVSDVVQNDIQVSGSSASLGNELNSEVNPTQESIVQSDVQPVQDDVSQQPVVQENPALQPATSSVDLTAPLDFNSLYVNNDSQPITQDSVAGQDDIQMVPNSDFSSSMLNTISNEADGITSDSQYVQPIENQNVQPIENQNVDASFSNDGFSLAEPLVENAIDSNLNNNNVMYSEQVSTPSYISEVKSRIENNAFNTELGVMDSGVTESDLDKTVVVDKVNIPELDSVSDEEPKKVKKKKSFGVVIFIIILLVLLGAFAYFLYNYIF